MSSITLAITITSAVLAALEVAYSLGRRSVPVEPKGWPHSRSLVERCRRLWRQNAGRRRGATGDQIAAIVAAVVPAVLRAMPVEEKPSLPEVANEQGALLPESPLSATRGLSEPTDLSDDVAKNAVITIFRNEMAGNLESRVAIGRWQGTWRTDEEFRVSSIEITGRLTRPAVLDIATRIGALGKLQQKLAPVAGIDTFDFELTCCYSATNPPHIVSQIPKATELDWNPELVPRSPALGTEVDVQQNANGVAVKIAAGAREL